MPVTSTMAPRSIRKTCTAQARYVGHPHRRRYAATAGWPLARVGTTRQSPGFAVPRPCRKEPATASSHRTTRVWRHRAADVTAQHVDTGGRIITLAGAHEALGLLLLLLARWCVGRPLELARRWVLVHGHAGPLQRAVDCRHAGSKQARRVRGRPVQYAGPVMKPSTDIVTCHTTLPRSSRVLMPMLLCHLK
jgi:hypothetical protein